MMEGKVSEEAQPDLIPWTVGDIARGVAVVIALSLTIIVAVTIGAALFLGFEGLQEHLVILVLLSSLVLEGVMLLGAWLFSGLKYRCGWNALGFRSFNMKRALILVPVVLLAGLLINYLYQVLISLVGIEPPPAVPPEFIQSGLSLAMLSLLAIFVAPIAEETFFRGFIFTGIGKRFGYGWGAIASALLFAFAHIQPGALLPIFLLGLLLAWLYIRTHSIWPCILTHFAYNSLALLFVI